MAQPVSSAFLYLIPADPDVAGVGTRGSIYAMNNLFTLPTLVAMWDGRVTAIELNLAEELAITILSYNLALLFAAMIQASTSGISNYHMHIVLMMSWMSSTNAWVYFILYIHHKIGLPEVQGGVGGTWGAWVVHVKHILSCESSLIVHIPSSH
jgi:hypothetical protein